MATVMTAQRELHGYISEVSEWSLSFTDSLALTFGCQVGVVRARHGRCTHAPAKCQVRGVRVERSDRLFVP